MTDDEKRMVLSLVRAQVINDIDNYSYVRPYTKIHHYKAWPYIVKAGGHWRRKAMYARLLRSLAMTCTLQELVYTVDRTRSAPALY